MDAQIAASIVKIIIFLPIVLILAYLSLKVGGSRMMSMNNGKLIKVIERVPLSSKAFLYVAEINKKYYVMSSSEEKVEILMEIPSEDINNINNGKGNFKDVLMSNINQLFKRKDKL